MFGFNSDSVQGTCRFGSSKIDFKLSVLLNQSDKLSAVSVRVKSTDLKTS